MQNNLMTRRQQIIDILEKQKSTAQHLANIFEMSEIAKINNNYLRFPSMLENLRFSTLH